VTKHASATFTLPAIAPPPHGRRYRLTLTPTRPAPPSVKLTV
jgi:hypothetical protein